MVERSTGRDSRVRMSLWGCGTGKGGHWKFILKPPREQPAAARDSQATKQMGISAMESRIWWTGCFPRRTPSKTPATREPRGARSRAAIEPASSVPMRAMSPGNVMDPRAIQKGVFDFSSARADGGSVLEWGWPEAWDGDGTVEASGGLGAGSMQRIVGRYSA